MVASEAAAETVWLVAREQSKYWRSVSPKACEPQEGMSIYLFRIVILQPVFQKRPPSPSQCQVCMRITPRPIRLTFMTEILKLHRQYYLYSKHDMMQVPLVGAELEQRFSAQVMCTYV
jgi:histone deacetylase 6